MRFSMVTTFYPPFNFGGDGIFVHQLSNELASHGHHVEVVHCLDVLDRRGDGTQEHDDADQTEDRHEL